MSLNHVTDSYDVLASRIPALSVASKYTEHDCHS